MESNNLIIRDTVFSDCLHFVEWEKKSYILENFTMSQGRDYEEIVREFVLRQQDKDKLQYTIVLRDGNRPIGRIYISRIDASSDSLDITRIYIGEEDCLSKGYGEEAMRVLLELCFMKIHTERVTLDHVTTNYRAAALYQKLGFQYEGILRHAGKKDGKYIDLHLMSMLRSEYYECCKRME